MAGKETKEVRVGAEVPGLSGWVENSVWGVCEGWGA